MPQMLLGGDGIVAPKTDEETRREEETEFYKKELEELRQAKNRILSEEPPLDENGEIDWDWRRNILGKWWYCNHITGWNNNVPSERKLFVGEYDDVPPNDFMADCIRDCFVSVERDGVKYDKAFALERVNKAIDNYEALLKNPAIPVCG